MSGDHPNYIIVEISHNNEKNPRDFRRLAVPQTSVRNHQLMLVWKTLKGVNNNNDVLKSILERWGDLDFREDYQLLLLTTPYKQCEFFCLFLCP